MEVEHIITKTRDYYFDNAKFILIFLVVLGHCIRPFTTSNELMYSLYGWIFFFHMPAFILISGYFAKNFRKPGHYKKLVIKLLLPYVAFETLYALLVSLLSDKKFELTLFSPYWIMWFLLSLFCWQLLLLVITKCPFPFLLSILIAVAAGYFDSFSKDFSLLRTFTFFPFFLAGYLLQKQHFDYLKTTKVRIASVLFLTGLFAYIHVFHNISFRWLWASRPYSYYGYEGIEAASYRLIYFVVMFGACAAFFSLVISQKTLFSKLGIYTLYTYLLHGFFIRFFMYKQPILKEIETIWDFLLLLGFSTVICYLTTLPFVRKCTFLIIEPYYLISKFKRNKTETTTNPVK